MDTTSIDIGWIWDVFWLVSIQFECVCCIILHSSWMIWRLGSLRQTHLTNDDAFLSFLNYPLTVFATPDAWWELSWTRGVQATCIFSTDTQGWYLRSLSRFIVRCLACCSMSFGTCSRAFAEPMILDFVPSLHCYLRVRTLPCVLQHELWYRDVTKRTGQKKNWIWF